MNIKRTVGSIAAAAMCAASLCACNAPSDAPQKKVRVYMPDGAPAIAMAELMYTGYYNTEFTVVPANAIRMRVASGDADLAIMPINAAASMYNEGAEIVMLSVNTHGNLYLVGAQTEDMTLADLKGKRVGVIGQNQVPDLTLRMMLKGSDIEYTVSNTADPDSVAIRYGADGPSLLPLLKNGDIDYAFLGEPAATTAANAQQKAIVMDAQQQWVDVFGGEYPQACLIAKKSVLENDPVYIKWFLRALKSSDGWAEQNPDKAIAAVKSHMEDGTESTLPATLPAAVVSRCNIKTVFAADAKATCETYFERLTQIETGLGTTALTDIPDAGFYYGE